MGHLYCYKCGGNHASNLHDAVMTPSKLPIETPPHNGPYQGTLPVRVIPPGVSGQAPIVDPQAKKFKEKVDETVVVKCPTCGKEFRRNNRQHTHIHCSQKCRSRACTLRRRARREKLKHGRKRPVKKARNA